MSLLELFALVDDFHREFERWAAQQQLPCKAKRGPKPYGIILRPQATIFGGKTSPPYLGTIFSYVTHRDHSSNTRIT